jgi:methionyl-tRNA formyltransferase
MRVVFLGTPEWAVPSLRALVDDGQQVAGVVTAPDKPAGRSSRPRPSPVKQAAQELGLDPILQPRTLKSKEVRTSILSLEPDVLAVVAYGKILPGRVLDAPRFGAVNLHFSLLPRHRGASPVQHTLLMGDEQAGVSTMVMDRGLDTGPVLQQRSTPIEPGEKARQLGARLAQLGAPLLVASLRGLEDGSVTPRPQDDRGATEAPLLTREMGYVRWEEPAAALARRIRAFDPWPPVIARCAKGTLRLLDASAADPGAEDPAGAPAGTVLGRQGEALVVACGDGGRLVLDRVQPEGRRPMPGAACLAGRYAAVGERLGDGSGP